MGVASTECAEPWLTYDEAAVRLKVSKTTVRRWIDDGELAGRDESPNVDGCSVATLAQYRLDTLGDRRGEPASMPGWLTIRQAGDRLGLFDTGVRNRIRRGLLVAKTVETGKLRRVWVEETSVEKLEEEGSG